MNRAELQQLTSDRIEDARILLENSRWTAAYYLVGYAVETGLKACILKFVEDTGIIFKDKKYAEKCWTHHIEDLVKHANLEPERGKDIAVNQTRGGYWGVVKDWKETSRYEQKTEAEARNLYEAVTNDSNGVFPWIQHHW
ncbi:MAG: HEPN domain-containing protein [Chloroflexi bacterium]|nr:HEPN domain-containing protein [Chloroflexota bacterium]